jgi:hypothetical protein
VFAGACAAAAAMHLQVFTAIVELSVAVSATVLGWIAGRAAQSAGPLAALLASLAGALSGGAAAGTLLCLVAGSGGERPARAGVIFKYILLQSPSQPCEITL